MGKNIIVAEDSDTTRRFIQIALKMLGHKVHLSEDGEVASNKLSEFDPDLVITDLNMPNMDGVELIKHIRSFDKFKDLPIIILTSLSKDEDVSKALDAGGNSYLQKPFEKSTLINEVKKYLA